MSARVFVDVECAPGDLVAVPPADVKHLTHVLRLKAGDEITLVSHQKAWRAQLEAVQGTRVLARVRAPVSNGHELPCELIVLQGLPKGSKMDTVIEKVTELGASHIVPMVCERSCTRPSSAKLERWRRIARAAAAQSQRLAVPRVEDALPLPHALDRLSGRARLLVAWEQAPAGSLTSALRATAAESALAILIGPEGSFTAGELDAMREADGAFVSLGRTTLRTETAAAAAIAAICALRGWW
jgi:16S rRNA (uracil1498-N3)-methyltransferase